MKRFSQTIYEEATRGDHKFWYDPKSNTYDAWSGGSIHHINRLMGKSMYSEYVTPEMKKRYKELEKSSVQVYFDHEIVSEVLDKGLVRGIVNKSPYSDRISLFLLVSYNQLNKLQAFVKKWNDIYPSEKYLVDWMTVEWMIKPAKGMPEGFGGFGYKTAFADSDQIKIKRFLKSGRVPR